MYKVIQNSNLCVCVCFVRRRGGNAEKQAISEEMIREVCEMCAIYEGKMSLEAECLSDTDSRRQYCLRSYMTSLEKLLELYS